MKRIDDHHSTLPIIELYPCIQGEGSRAGRPVIAIRTTGCTHRCHFGQGGWCDTWYSSIHAEKGRFCFQDILDLHAKYPQVKELMITGGAPTMHPSIINELMHYAHDKHLFVTLETEGSHALETDYSIDLISLSPKFSNSVPKLGELTPLGKIVDASMIAQHNKYRLNHTAIAQLLSFHKDYHFKPVWDGSRNTLLEIKHFMQTHKLTPEKTYLMPAGQTREDMVRLYPLVMETSLNEGFNFSGRSHIIAFDDKRGV